MNAALSRSSVETSATSAALAGFYTRVGVSNVQRRCPFCESIVYSRRHKLCGVCSAELPAGVLFSSDQAQNVNAILHEERQKHRAWMQRFGVAN